MLLEVPKIDYKIDFGKFKKKWQISYDHFLLIDILRDQQRKVTFGDIETSLAIAFLFN